MSFSILVADDEPALRTVLTLALRADGHTVEAVMDGQEALEWLEREALPDALIVDNNMPRKGGIEVLRELRANARYSGVAAILLTAEDDERTRARAFEAGADAVLQKPMRNAELRFKVREVIEAKQGAVS